MAERSRPGFRALGDVLGAEARRMKLDGAVGEAAAVLLWPEVVGEQIAAVTEPERVRDGVLYVIARTHTWAFELTFHRQQILKGLNARLGRNAIKEIRFRPGAIPAGAAAPPPEPAPADADLAAVELTPAEVEAVEREAIQVADSDLQALVRRMLTNERKRAVWHREHGFRPCGACGALHAGPGASCPACRREARS